MRTTEDSTERIESAESPWRIRKPRKVTNVNSNDEAYKNGLRSGDELVAINGFECRCHKKVCSIIDQASRDGICLYMSVKRGSRRHKYWNIFTGFIRLPWRKHPRPN